MSKNLLIKVVVGLLFVGVAVVWLLSALDVISVNLSWVIGIFCAALGLVFILKGLFSKNLGIVKKIDIIIGCALLVAAVFAVIGSFVEDTAKLVFPIIAVAITVCALLAVLATGGKKWDQADNENVGYKNYYERKKEEEKNNKEED
ncbi:MAG: hypothetical protein J6Y68_02560 [Clostridia bacterium]|nr:hypothetical protein [Clostridia bacterium]MBP5593570.1 hypothetical protein [Clostridia bacterium]